MWLRPLPHRLHPHTSQDPPFPRLHLRNLGPPPERALMREGKLRFWGTIRGVDGCHCGASGGPTTATGAKRFKEAVAPLTKKPDLFP